MKLRKHDGNPILTAKAGSDWEALAVLNPGAIEHEGKVWLFYRASAEQEAYRIYIGLAESTDGFRFERVSGRPILAPTEGTFDGGCVEDARVVRYGDTFYMTYACRAWPPALHWKGQKHPDPPARTPVWLDNLSRTGLARSTDLRTWEKLGPVTRDDVDDRDGILFPEPVGGRYAMLHRPMSWVGERYGCEGPSMWLTWSDDLLHWEGEHLVAKGEQAWEGGKVGGSTPPIKTDEGWLTLFHGVDGDRVYRVGAMMLGLEEPWRVVARAPDFLMEPEAEWERVGIVPNVVFPCGNVVLGDELFVYYGGADQVCCAATCRLQELVDYVLQYRR